MNIVERPIFSEIEGFLKTEEILVLTGCRQSGKTTTFRYLFDKVGSPNKLFLDLENVLNRKYFEEDNYEAVKASFEFQGIDFSKRAYIFLDEIQYVKNLPSVVKYLRDKYNIKFFLTGSASFYLKNLFSESLAGRKYIFHIWPLTFREFLGFKGHKVKNLKAVPEGLSVLLEGLFSEYLNFGGFPGVVLKETGREKKMKLQDIFSSYFEMEVERLRDFAKLNKVRDTLLLLFARGASLLDISRISQELGISRITLGEYLDFFEKTFFFSFIKPFSVRKDVEIRKRSKVYSVDVGLAREMGFRDEGGLLETAIYQNLRGENEVNYYRRKDGREIDFILNKKKAVEVKSFCHQQDISLLKRILVNLKGISGFKVVTLRRQIKAGRYVEWAPHFCLRI
ncbi:MAG: ATP-binding protein [Candidatus Omnitrophota bacterium]|nr:ATP-binding protein [Candidatus Omnitrophota bacterium]